MSIKISNYICKPLLFIACILAPVFGFSQSSDSVGTVYSSSSLRIAYNSSLVYPGIRFGVGLPVSTTHVIQLNKSGIQKTYLNDCFITGNLGWYHQTGFHDNFYLTAGWTIRRTKSHGFFTEFSPEMGISRTFLSSTTYNVDNAGNVEVKKYAGYYYALLSVGGGIGYDFEQTRHMPFLIFSRFNVLMMFPYNSTIYLRPAIEIGFACKPSNFLTLKVKSKSEIK